MKAPNKILGKILAITKEIYLAQPANISTRTDVFVTGEGTPVRPRQVHWWITWDGVRETQELARMIIDCEPQLAGADRPTVQLEIDKVLKENFFNGDLFDVRAILTRNAPTLFAASAAANKQEFAERLWEKIRSAALTLAPSWLILYPLRGIAPVSADIGFDGLSLMAPDDKQTWERFAERYPLTATFDPAEGSPERISAPTVWGMKLPTADENRPFTWLVCEAKGTRHNVKRLATGRMRTFLALLFSHWHPTDGDFFVIKSELEEHRCALQFAAAGDRDEGSVSCGVIGRLMPSLTVNFGISPAALSLVRDWYASLYSAHEELRRRAITASHFIHYGTMADSLERFIHYYIALDALFGERHKVEVNIQKGVEHLFPNDQLWVYRAEHLFDLRNALVHGGTSSIDGWKDFDAYMRHVKTSPMEDVANAAMTALRTYFVSPPQFLTLPPP